MRLIAALVAGIVMGFALAAEPSKTDRLPGIIGINHIAVSTDDLPTALDFYKNKMGFDEAFRVQDERGQMSLVYLYASKDTFLELAVANPDRPPGIYHYGLVVRDIQATAAELAKRGVKVQNLRKGSTGSFVGTVLGPQGVNIELLQQGPESLQQKAIKAWTAQQADTP
jgi:catechol 2,3-dioxygenase-like lactoylglutathione lyase family enzyme